MAHHGAAALLAWLRSAYPRHDTAQQQYHRDMLTCSTLPACRWLEEAASDFRVGSEALKHTRFAVFGCGNSVYGDNFNVVAKAVDQQLAALGGSRLAAVGLGDEDAGSLEEQFAAWSSKVGLAACGLGMCWQLSCAAQPVHT